MGIYGLTAVALFRLLTTVDLQWLNKIMALTKSDFQAIKKLVRLEIDEALGEKLEQKLEEKLGRYPTKDEFQASMDKLMKELETIIG